MAVAALSTSALALAAGPVPAPATPAPAQVPEAFAELVARAKPDGKPSEEGAKPEDSTEGETETALSGDEASTTTPEGEAKASPAGTPVDLLARINEMVAAAGQIGISLPTRAAPAVPQAISASPSKAAAAISLAAVATPIAATASALPAAKAAPVPADTPAPQVALATSTLPFQQAVSAPVAAPTAPAAPTLPADATLPAEEDIVQAEQASAVAAPVRPAVLQRGSDIAQLLTSLRSAFASIDGKDSPAPAPIASVAAEVPAPQAPAPQPAAVPPAPSAAPAPTEAASPQPAIIAAVATAEAPVPVPVSVKPGTASATADLGGEEAAPLAAPAAPQVSEAPAASVVATIAPKSEAPVAAALLDLPVVDTDEPIAPAEPALVAEPDVRADRAEAPAAPVAALADTAAPLPAAAPSAPAPSASLPADGSAPATAQVDQSVTRELDLVRDNQWLDRLARDISQAASRDGQIKFQLNPEHLGALTIEIANSAAGTAIRMTADTDQARAIIADAQPRLLAEVRAQGLRVAESHVDLNQQQGSGGSASAQAQQQQQNRQSSEDSKPFVRTQSTSRDDAADSAPENDGELYA